mmetsp:Transcript_28743/g.51039  ORF Transcript_28743/g.51039 Transcript_28743/m.51039 type:complete len:402 (-) Transcript_28743:6-1211(-)
MASEDVLLGYIGRKLGQELDVRISRFGGTPVWSKEPSVESLIRRPEYLKCRLCGKALVLFTQVSAAYGDRPKRLLHVFSCRSGTCSSDPRSWRVMRSTGQLEQEQQDAGHRQLQQTAGYLQSAPVPADDWGVPSAADDWSTPGAFATSADDEIEALLASRSAPPVVKAEQTSVATPQNLEDVTSSWQGVTTDLGRSGQWPCLSITIDYEPWSMEETAGEHEHELLQRYLHSELAEGEVDQMLASGALPKELQAEVENLRQESQLDANSDHEVATVCSEEDEDDEDAEEVIRAGGVAVNWLRRFQQRLARSPEQVMRYCWGGDPLWLHAPPTSKPPPCDCGAERCFELQLLPTLHARIAAAVPSVTADAMSMEWGSVAVFTCSKDCPCEDPREEFLFIEASL